jgi:hypothetical protein
MAIGYGVGLAQACFSSGKANISGGGKERRDLTDAIMELRGQRVNTSRGTYEGVPRTTSTEGAQLFFLR